MKKENAEDHRKDKMDMQRANDGYSMGVLAIDPGAGEARKKNTRKPSFIDKRGRESNNCYSLSL